MIFINNKYTSVYFQLITRAQSRALPKNTYKERHHIIPKCMGGSNDTTNITSLTAKEHCVCHRLLPHMVSDPVAKSKLKFASWAMVTRTPVSALPGVKRNCTSTYYAKLREHVANENRLRQLGVSPGNKGICHSAERKQKNQDVPNIVCPHCSKSSKPWLYARWHGPKCKILTDFCGPIIKQPKKPSNYRQFVAISPIGEETTSSNLISYFVCVMY